MSDFLERISKLPPKRLALLALELNSRLERLERRVAEPIAVVGIGCRFPGQANDPESFWRLLRDGGDAVAEIPAERWDLDAFYDPDPDAPGKMATRWGSFLAGADRFDAKFFGIAPREALGLDPHQRLLLEVAWEALEHAGQAPDRLLNSQTGVFVGPGNGDYYHRLVERGPAAVDAYLVSGNAHSMAAGRLSYFFGFRGPSLTVDTACSSSLVAVHLACQALRGGECRLALAGGANLILSPENMIGLSKAHMLSSAGRCKTFDRAADGIVRGEGCGVVALKRLSDAQADGDRVLAVLLGTAINQDGRSNGITAPNGPAQEAVIREALDRSGVKPSDIDYVEAHGTGTPLGDPIELRALGDVLGEGRPADRPVLVGSVKTNLGHLEIAAGIAGLIKTILAIAHEEIPPHLHFTDPNPYVDWDRLPVTVATGRTPWPRAEARKRLAGVSSFGFSGTNVHVIVAEAPVEPAPTTAGVDRPVHLLTLSARSAPALRDLAGRLGADVSARPDRALADVCFTANTGRAQLAERAAIVARDAGGVQASLSALASGGSDPGLFTGRAEGSEAPAIAFLFTGQGSQYVGMGRELFETQPVFRGALERCDELLRACSGEALIATLYPGADGSAAADARLSQTAFTQPALFAVEYALAELWRSWGIVPSVVAGHSIGEYVAACVAGAMSLDDGLRLIAARGRLMQALPQGGGMLAVLADEARVAAAVAPHAARAAVAAINGPRNTVISGDLTALETIRLALAAEGIESRPLNVSHAFHSPLLDPMLDEFERIARAVDYRPARIDLVSNLTGSGMGRGEIGAAYWRRHARQPVRFADAVRTIAAQGCRLFVEMGPAPILLGMGSQCLPEGAAVWLPSLRKGRSDSEQMLAALAALYVRGARVDWAGFEGAHRRRKVTLPSYPFQRERFWPEPAPRPRSTEVASPVERWREWLYEFTWEEDGNAARGRGPALRAPRAIAADVDSAVDRVFAEHGAAVYDDLYPKLDAACAAFILKAFDRLGCTFTPGDRLELEGLRERLGIVAAHARLLRRMLDILAEEGVLRRAGGAWEVLRAVAPVDPDRLMHDLHEQFPQCHAELGFTARSAPALADVLTGRSDPIQVLFPAGSLEAAEALYERAPALRVFNTLVARTIAAAIADRPEAGELRVLEIGAGTGGTTTYVLPELPAGRTRYTFTDISTVFTARARDKFRQYDFVEYRTFDAERDPEEQGFAPGGFDIVVAANVLHATADLKQTLAHVRRLLAPGGLLVLLESTKPQRFGDLTVGYTDGWWRFSDTALRPSYALLPAERWVDLLDASGFQGAVAVPGDRFAGRAVFANQTVLVAEAAPATAAEAPDARLDGTFWLLCGNEGEVGGALAAEVRARGGRCLTVESGQRYEAHGDGRITVDPDRPADFVRLLDDTRSIAAGRARAAIHLWSLDARDASAGSSVDDVEAQVRRSCGSALHLAQALAAAEDRGPRRLVIVTRGAVPIDAATPVAVSQAPVWGLGRALDLEHPELRCTRIDVDSRPPTSLAPAILEELARGGADDRQVALRNGTRRLLRVVRGATAAEPTRRATIRPDATYLVTGGLAGLGLLVARWLADRGARHLALAARSEPTAEARAQIAALEARGIAVTTLRADVSRQADVERVLEAIASSAAPLKGIIHSAGSLDDGVILQQRWDRFAKVMAAKVRGSWLLHQATAALPLDFFVMFSSGASFLGSPGQSNHAAANAFLDALAAERRAARLPALSINWGAWSEVGAATRGGVVERVETRGLGPIDPERGLRVLEHLMAGDAVQTAVLPIHWPEFIRAFGQAGAPPLFARVAPAQAGGAERLEAPAPQEERLLDSLSGQPVGRVKGALLDRIGREASRVLGLNPADAIDPAEPLNALGMDSLMAVELRNALSRLVGRPLPATLLFSYPTLAELVEFFAADVAAARGPAEPAAPASAAAAAAVAAVTVHDLDAMSEEELASLLSGKLGDV